MMIRKSSVAAIALVGVLGVVAGCGADDSPDEQGEPRAQEAPLSASTPRSEADEPEDESPSAGATSSPKSGGSGQADGEEGPSAASGEGSGAADGAASDSPTPGGMPTRGPDGNQESVLVNLPGPATQRCVAVGNERSVRSGSMAAGPFDEARASYKAGTPETQTLHFYFIPEQSKKMPGITVTMKHEDTGKVVTVRQKRWADADEFRFYDIETGLPRGGTWRITAVTGPDRGCWTVVLP